LIKTLELAKTAYSDKFGLNPDELTGSPVKKTAYEYTKEYEKLWDTQVYEQSEEQQSVYEEEPQPEEQEVVS